ncbi:hypothetical protein AVEN_121167-1 [Araneus ventricosus]|uniref:Uncharacterized protein n=1 Tax=Araneus ventricosus TaxID=182803 RepID=A0A4Y2E2U1_ARAVE|nr:hypothetical protein AVEN_121167-1 [Araneus ventricosus]
MKLVILNRGQMTRTAAELAPPPPNFRTTPATGRLTHDGRFKVHQAHMHDSSLVKSGFKLGPSGPEAETIPLNHRCPVLKIKK